jgi:hypothetical protein
VKRHAPDPVRVRRGLLGATHLWSIAFEHHDIPSVGRASQSPANRSLPSLFRCIVTLSPQTDNITPRIRALSRTSSLHFTPGLCAFRIYSPLKCWSGCTALGRRRSCLQSTVSKCDRGGLSEPPGLGIDGVVVLTHFVSRYTAGSDDLWIYLRCTFWNNITWAAPSPSCVPREAPSIGPERRALTSTDHVGSQTAISA